jgi:hypothetical protein
MFQLSTFWASTHPSFYLSVYSFMSIFPAILPSSFVGIWNNFIFMQRLYQNEDYYDEECGCMYSNYVQISMKGVRGWCKMIEWQEVGF